MGVFELTLIGIGLSMDAAAVSMSNGMCIRNIKIKHALATALAFGVFQGIMPMIGYFTGSVFAAQINAIDHWIALILLGFIGGKMIYESLSEPASCSINKRLTIRLLMVQSIATSIDALAVGVSFAALIVNILVASLIIAGATFVLSFISVYIGKRFGNILNKKAEIMGGLILIMIGIKIFIQHMIA